MKILTVETSELDPDVIVVAEIHRTWLDTLLKSDILKTYRYGTNLKYRHGRDISVFSRLPVSRMQLIEAEERVSIAVDIPLGDETLRLFCVHSPRPRFGARNEYAEFWQEVVPTVAAEPRPLVMLGDFNATQHSLVYKQLAADGLRSAHEDRGRGYATTWPNGRRPVPPIRIDQALLSADVECISITEGEGPGSDHKPLILEIRVHAAGPRGGKS
jgi:endonuclease/exonuclease/phosphatase (EEP) superfamily protein YafD